MKKAVDIINSCKDPVLAKKLRTAFIEKVAQQSNKAEMSVLEHTSNSIDYDYRWHGNKAQRGSEEDKYEPRLYDYEPDHPKSVEKVYEAPKSLSTRYSPDHVGVQAKRISDGVYQDPYTNKIYDYNSGFKTDHGDVIPASGVALQSQIYNYAFNSRKDILVKLSQAMLTSHTTGGWIVVNHQTGDIAESKVFDSETNARQVYEMLKDKNYQLFALSKV